MQAFRADTTIDERGDLQLPRIPFRPGTAVEVIVLERGNALVEEPERQESLADRQYRLAGKYPEEYVVLVGDEIVHHTRDREEATDAFDRAALGSKSRRPVIVSPGHRPQRFPVVRGRALAGKLKRPR